MPNLRPIGKLARPLICAFAAACMWPTAGVTADKDGKFALKGAGFLPCQVFVQERKQQSSVYFMIAGWLEGFVSAHNRYSPQTFDIASFETTELLLGVVQKHCESHPKDQLYPVISSILAQMQPDRAVTDSPKVAISEGKRNTELYRDTILKMQQRLTALRLYKGKVDGRYTDATRSALKAFQSDIDLETTGFPDQTTLWRLFRK